MKYEFPIIETIDDVLPIIAGKEEFKVLEKEGYTVIDYVLSTPTTFPEQLPVPTGNAETILAVYEVNKNNAILRECRGLAFSPDGKLISRPFHKFFNWGEKLEEQDIELTGYESILKKMDGSMIRPLIIDGNIRLATRKGITDIAMQAEVFTAAKDNYIALISSYCNSGYTPIFEWCSRQNQVVIEYIKENLILLAVRENKTGAYLSYEALEKAGKNFNVPVVEIVHTDNPLKAKDLEDEEGYVIVYPDGHRLKIKSDWYVKLHKAKELIGREKDLLNLYLNGNVDDVLPLLPVKDRLEVVDFLTSFTEETITTAKRLDGIFTNIVKKMPDTFTRKEFAHEVLKLDPKYKWIMFLMLTGKSTLELLYEALKNASTSNKKLEEFRWIFGGIRFGGRIANVG